MIPRTDCRRRDPFFSRSNMFLFLPLCPSCLRGGEASALATGLSCTLPQKDVARPPWDKNGSPLLPLTQRSRPRRKRTSRLRPIAPRKTLSVPMRISPNLQTPSTPHKYAPSRATRGIAGRRTSGLRKSRASVIVLSGFGIVSGDWSFRLSGDNQW